MSARTLAALALLCVPCMCGAQWRTRATQERDTLGALNIAIDSATAARAVIVCSFLDARAAATIRCITSRPTVRELALRGMRPGLYTVVYFDARGARFKMQRVNVVTARRGA